MDALVRGESVHRLVLGVGLAPADVARQLRASVGLADREGLLVRSVAPDSPAERAGVKTGDLITQADGHDVATVDDLHTALDAARGGRHLTLHVVRGAEELDLTVDFDETSERLRADGLRQPVRYRHGGAAAGVRGRRPRRSPEGGFAAPEA